MTVHLLQPAADAPFALLREMAEAPRLIHDFDPARVALWRSNWQQPMQMLISGEGSSRIFPAKNLIARARHIAPSRHIFTEGARQAAELPLDDTFVIALSNSGRTREAVGLAGKTPLHAITAHDQTPLVQAARHSILLSCGQETAVAASKSVIEQALLLQAMVEEIAPERLTAAAAAAQTALTATLPEGAAQMLAAADTAYIAGRNDGVAEEIALKCCEIPRIKSMYLEGTYVLHGIEEVMTPRDCVVLIEPFSEEIERYQCILRDGVGLSVIAIARGDTPFPTIRIPQLDGFDGYLRLMAGWRLLTAAAQLRGIDMDKTARARKVGNAVETPP